MSTTIRIPNEIIATAISTPRTTPRAWLILRPHRLLRLPNLHPFQQVHNAQGTPW